MLRAVAELNAVGKSAGRDAIAALPAARSMRLGPGAIRARLERLDTLGLVTSKRGRGGTSITASGASVIADSREI